LFGAEFEARITLDPLFGEEFAGLGLGTNLTVMSSQVTLSDADAEALAIYGVNETTQPMTATPDFIWNINATYQYEPWGTQLGIFYNLQGQSLISAANPYTTLLTPAIYQLSYGTLNFTCSQEIIEGLRFSVAAKNILNPEIQTQYQTTEGITGLQSSYTAGVDFSIGLTYQITF
jgi:outer membrane receptor protein involved in Fe transport